MSKCDLINDCFIVQRVIKSQCILIVIIFQCILIVIVFQGILILIIFPCILIVFVCFFSVSQYTFLCDLVTDYILVCPNYDDISLCSS